MDKAIADLPVLLCGPVVREASESRLVLWFATSLECDLRCEVRVARASRRTALADKSSEAVPMLATMNTWKRMKLAESLWLQSVSVEPKGLSKRSFPAGVQLEIHLARLEEKIERGRASTRAIPIPMHSRSLNDEGSPRVVVGRQGEVRPNFAIASCRKPHGEGIDALSGLLSAIGSRGPTKRLESWSVFLIGDQIYADDVEPVLFEAAVLLATKLRGRPVTEGRDRLPAIYYGAGTRSKLVERRYGLLPEHAGYSVDFGAGSNHLLEPLEFAAMYLLAWSPDAWDWVIRERTRLRASAKAVADRLQELRRLAVDACKLLANFSCQLLGDDHEVTDDWNSTPAWSAQVARSKRGGPASASGLSMYWAFQRFGGDSSSDSDRLMSAVQTFMSDPTKHAKGFLDTCALADVWTYISPTSPMVLMVDARNARRRRDALEKDYVFTDSGKVELDPNRQYSLFSASAAARRFREVIARGKDSLAFVAVAQPVLICPGVERAKAGLSASPLVDEDGWETNLRSTSEFLDYLRSLERSTVCLFSGDVHYSYILDGRITTSMGPTRIVQITTSPTKNQWKGVVARVLERAAASRAGVRLGVWIWRPTEDGGSYHVLGPDQVSDRVRREAVAELGRPADQVLQGELAPLEYMDQFGSSPSSSRVATANAFGLVQSRGAVTEARIVQASAAGVAPLRPVEIGVSR